VCYQDLFRFTSLRWWPCVLSAVRLAPETALSASAPISTSTFRRVDDTSTEELCPTMTTYTHPAALGVKTIVDLTESDGDADEPRMVKTAGMKLVDIPMTTHPATHA
jgi:hypothetical protein